MVNPMPEDQVSGQSTTAGLAPYAMPYVADLFGRTAAVLEQDYQPYAGQRVAQFSDLQNQAAAAAAGLAPSAYLTDAASAAQNAINRAQGLSYTPGTISEQQVTGASLGAAPTARAASFSGPSNVSAPALRQYLMQAAQTNYDPTSKLQNYQMGAAERVGTDRFIDPTNAQDYMSPYIQQVLDIQRREAQRAADIATTQRNASAVQSGAYGGSRQAIMDAEAQRNLATQLNDIEATGLQAAYQNAQSQFNADQARALQAAQANQAAGINVGGQNLQALLSTQGLGAQLGTNVALANLSNQQAANQANLQSQLSTQQLGANTSLQAQLANQQAQYNTALQNAQMQQQAALANQALQGQYGITGAQLAQQANLANQQANLQAQQMQQQANQFGATYDLNALNAALTGASQLGNLGNTQFNQGLNALNAQNTIGTQQQQAAQNVLDQQYQDYMTQQQYPMQQLNWASNIYRGYPMGSSNTSYQYQDPNLLSQLAGAGMTAYALDRMAEGGQVKSPRSSGLADLLISKLG